MTPSRMKPWQELRAELIGFGFLEVLHSELTCRRCGDFRVAFLPDSEPRVICPRCCAPVDFAVLGRGLTRVLSDAICISPSLSDRHKAHREDPVFVQPCKLNTRRRRPEFLERARRELMEVLPKLTTRIREPQPAPQPRPRNHRATPEEMRRRIVLLAELLLRREPPEVISKTLGIEWQHLRVTICRRKEEIRSVMGTLQGSGSHVVR